MLGNIEARLPTFLIIGAMKSGTTSLHRHLSTHPDISMSRKKETNYFLGPEQHHNDIEWYASQFDPDKPFRGESSTNYTKDLQYGGVPERIHSLLPDVKLVFTARDPIARIASHWMHNRAHGRETRSFSRAISDPKYVNASSYAHQLAPYVELFGRDHLLIVDAEALLAETADVVRSVVDFVGARTDVPVDTSRGYNASDEKTEPAFVHRQMRRLGLSERGPVSKVVNRLPDRLRARRPVTRPVIEGRDLATLRRSLAEDAAEFRRLSGMSFDHWRV